RRTLTDGSFLTKALVNPLTVTGTLARAASTTEYSEGENNNWSAGATWQLNPQRGARSLGLGGLMNGLPRWLRESEGGQGIARGTVSLAPTAMRIASNLTRQAGDFTSFAVPIRRLEDTALTPVTTLQHTWRNDASITWQ